MPFTSMATGMILSVSWGTKEISGEEKDPEEGSEEVAGAGDSAPLDDKAADPAPKQHKEQANKRAEFEINA